MPDDKEKSVKIDLKDRDKRYVYTDNDVKSIFQYGSVKKSTEKNEKK